MENISQNLGDHCEETDMISQLPDEMLVKVLLFLSTKVAVSTCILSKRWEFLWMWLPRLEYNDDDYSDDERRSLRNFIDLNLPLHRAPVIESFSLKLVSEGGYFRPIRSEVIEKWVLIAVSHCVRELSVSFETTPYKIARLPSSLYTCKCLVILKLAHTIYVDVPRMARLLSLKILTLRRVSYQDEKSLHRLLSNCPVLEVLVVERDGQEHGVPFTLTVNVQSLERLTLKISRGFRFDGLVINTPSLKYFNVKDYRGEYTRDSHNHSYSYYLDNMPKLGEADIKSTYPDINKCFRSITFIKRLSLCIRVNAEEDLCPEGIVFDQLQHQKLCSCDSNWSKLLVRLLKGSPNLWELELYLNDDHTSSSVHTLVSWQNQLDCVPTCLLSSLETFKWTGIYGSQEEIDVVKYILRNACRLKTATILFRDKQEMMIQELSLCVPSSTACQLIFE